MNWYHKKEKGQTCGITATFKMLKYLSLMALIDVNWMAEVFLLRCPCDVKKIFYLLFKVFKQFY